ncbi:MAG: NAD(P)-dependent oxidoreductase [Thermosynechococcaceae cyanobacterium]
MKIGFIGTGLMGAPMAARLLNQHHVLTVYNRSPEKLVPLQTAGAIVATSPAEVIQSSDCTVLMLTDAAAIQSILLSETAQAALKHRTIVQMGTIAPLESQTIRDAIVAAGGDYLEAPVLGSIPEAKVGELIVMVGANLTQFQRWLPVLSCMGTQPSFIGPVGTAAALKLALNQLIGSLTTAFALSLGFTQQYGVETERFMEILRVSALYAPTFDKKLPRMEGQTYRNPNFPVKHLLKDMALFQAAAPGLQTGTVEAIQKLLEQTLKDHAEDDYSALFSCIQTEDHHTSEPSKG